MDGLNPDICDGFVSFLDGVCRRNSLLAWAEAIIRSGGILLLAIYSAKESLDKSCSFCNGGARSESARQRNPVVTVVRGIQQGRGNLLRLRKVFVEEKAGTVKRQGRRRLAFDEAGGADRVLTHER